MSWMHNSCCTVFRPNKKCSLEAMSVKTSVTRVIAAQPWSQLNHGDIAQAGPSFWRAVGSGYGTLIVSSIARKC